MRVLILTQYFTPEIGATSTRVHAFAAGLAARGHDVEVICEVPNHPQGIVLPGFAGRAVVRGRMDGFRTAWVHVRTRAEKTSRDRLLFYGSYAAAAVAYGSLTARPDVILASSPPLPVGAAAAALARRHRAPWILDVRDLWPIAAVALGELRSGRALAVAERLERFLYRDAAAITAVTRPFIAHIGPLAGGTPIHLLPNGTTRFWMDAASIAPDKAAAGLDAERFTWTFAGNVGLAQGLDAAVEAARLLGDGFRLLILGAGAARPGLERQAAAIAPHSVEFRDQVPPEEAARLLAASDALLVSLADSPALEAFVPSKLFDFCAVGRPVVLAAAGEPRRLAEAAGAAVLTPPGDPEALAAAVRSLRDDPDRATRISAAGREFAAANLRDRHLDALEALLAEVGRRPSGSTAPLNRL
jgi:glycosyltransferase involved in cell wall biosynthesis